jgi:hypothetical protein
LACPSTIAGARARAAPRSSTKDKTVCGAATYLELNETLDSVGKWWGWHIAEVDP